MNNDELIEYAIRTSNAIKEEIKPKLIDYFYKQKEVINKAIEYLNQPNRDNFDFSKAILLDILQKDYEE